MGRKIELGLGWAHNPSGFRFEHGGQTHQAHCQENVGTGSHDEPARACGARARYARTIWDAGVLFACGRHVDQMEDFARPMVAMGSRGAAVLRPVIAAPLRWDVPGAADPPEHPVHVGVRETEDGRIECWCGAMMVSGLPAAPVWTGGKPVDPPWWERQRERRQEEAEPAA